MAKRKQKRANKEGSIFQRSNGNWRAQVTVEGRRLSFSAKTQRECRQWVQEIQNQIEDGLTYESTKITLGEYLTEWLLGVEATVRPTTYTQYHQLTRDYILPSLAEIKLRELRPDHIQFFYSQQLSEGVGTWTVRMIHTVLHRALNQALEFGIVSRNSASVVKLPPKNWTEMKFYDAAQVQSLLITAKAIKHRYLALFKLAVTTGMRQGELLGLKWSDLDWDSKSLQVQRQLKRKKGGGFRFAPPKSKAGNRAIVLGGDTLALLKQHQEGIYLDRLKAGSRWKEFDLIFPSLVGTPTQPDKIIKRFKRLIVVAGLPEIRFHDLRHTAAALMLNNNVPIIVVSRRLGHSKPSITLDVYGHLINSMQQDVAELMDQITAPIEISIST